MNIKELISSIYECQKRIIFTRKLIGELINNGMKTSVQEEEIRELEKKITEFQKVLKKKYKFVY